MPSATLEAKSVTSKIEITQCQDHLELRVDGLQVPHVNLHEIPSRKGSYNVTVGNFSVEMSTDEINRFGWFLANTMAYSNGYSCFGPKSEIVNPWSGTNN